MGIFIYKVLPGIREVRDSLYIGASLRALLSRLLKGEVFSGEEIQTTLPK